VANVFRSFGDPGVFAASGAMYLVGLAARDRDIGDVGLHTGAAIVASGVVTGSSRLPRARPAVRHERHQPALLRPRPRDRHLERVPVVPSGHTTAAFAFAAALSLEGRHRWPRANRVTGPVGYTAAALTGLSRLYHDRHWASDAAMGAGIGIVAGRATVRALPRPWRPPDERPTAPPPPHRAPGRGAARRRSAGR
jgi:membrane-associated phospholipid phosphatase